MPEKPLNYQSTVRFAALKAGQQPEPVAVDETTIESGTCTQAEPFALQVKGNSMAPEFRDGCVVIIDPSVVPKQGSYVIADCGEHGYLLRELNICDGMWHLITSADQDTEPQIKIAPDQGAILGVIVQLSGAKGGTNKLYQ